MADSATALPDPILQSQASKEITANAAFDALSPAALYGRRASQCSGLTWGYYGGKVLINGVVTSIASGTIPLNSSTTAYIEADPATGAVSTNTTGFTAGRWPLYQVVTGLSSVTSYTDCRLQAVPTTGKLQKALSDANTTLTAAEARNQILQFTGTLSAQRNVVLPLNPQQWTVYNGTNGSLQFIGASGTGVVVETGKRTMIYADGTNVVRVTADTVTGTLTLSGDIVLSGAARRITGDFSNATITDRVLYQTSSSNSNTLISAIPNGNSGNAGSAWIAYNNATPTNSSFISVAADQSAAYVSSDKAGTGTYLPLAFISGGSEAMRLDSSRNLMVGTTSQVSSAKVSVSASANGLGVSLTGTSTTAIVANLTSTTNQYAAWLYNGSQIGSITTNGTTVAYNTSSDYRLKENIQPMQNALARVAQLKPVTYTWKINGAAGEGFIAHELQEVCPGAVTGEKDAVDEDGNPIYQGIDTSFVIGLLTAAIQELKSELDSAKARIAALEAR